MLAGLLPLLPVGVVADDAAVPGACPLDPSQASVTINVEVSDGDGGVTTGSVVVGQTATLCGSRYTGALSAPAANGSCPAGSVALTLPSASPTTFCINPYTGAMIWKMSGSCASGYAPISCPTVDR